MTPPAATAALTEPGAGTGSDSCSPRAGCTRPTARPPRWTVPTSRSATGEIVAVMGPSGSGKSTLLHCLAGIVPPDSGTVTYRGQELSSMSDAQRSALRRGDFGFVFQFGQLVPELSCVENAALPLRLAGFSRKECRVTRRGVAGAAGGRRRTRTSAPARSPAARASASRSPVPSRLGPRVLFADEPTGALDSLNGERVMQLLTDAARESRAAVVLVTHESRVAAYSDREVVVRDGRARSMAGAL